MTFREVFLELAIEVGVPERTARSMADATDRDDSLGAAQSHIHIPPEKLGAVRHVLRELLTNGKPPIGSQELFDSITNPVLKSN